MRLFITSAMPPPRLVGIGPSSRHALVAGVNSQTRLVGDQLSLVGEIFTPPPNTYTLSLKPVMAWRCTGIGMSVFFVHLSVAGSDSLSHPASPPGAFAPYAPRMYSLPLITALPTSCVGCGYGA